MSPSLSSCLYCIFWVCWLSACTSPPTSESAAAYQSLHSSQPRIDLENGDYYIGQTAHGFMQGEGHYHSEAEGWAYTGQWFQSQFHGKGSYRCPAGNTYEGHYNRNLREGYGVFVYRIGSGITKAVAGDYYCGEWEADDYRGYGVLVHRDSSVEAGIWKDGHTLRELPLDSTLYYLNTKLNLALTPQELLAHASRTND